MQSINILLVDDQPARLLSYRTILEDLGTNLVSARSGTEALTYLMQTEFAVILLDVNMPGMDGFEAAQLIHQHPRHEATPIVFVTAVNVTDADRIRGYAVGAVDYVSVPVVPQILRSKVAALCELYRQRRELQRLNLSLSAANEGLAAAHEALQLERALELRTLNEVLERANRELASSNASLQAEIAERRRVEEHLREAHRRKDEFLATLAHELRNPLAPIGHALEQLPASDESAGAVRIMRRQLRQMVRLIDDLLDASRLTRGKLTMRRRRTTLREVLDDAVESARPLLDAARQSLERPREGADVPLDADPERLAQVFSNLLNNASKFSEAGASIRIEVQCSDGLARVDVIDAGIGIVPEQLERIFDLFVQADTSLERSRSGLGIGLTLVQQLVLMHGGRVSAHSAGLGRGSRFRVELPVLDADASDAGRGPAVPAAQERSSSGPRRILVIDDNRDAADALGLCLQVLGHEVRTVYDPFEALQLAAAYCPEVMFVDVGLPRLNGYDLARRVRSQDWSRHTLMIALTGLGQEEDRRRSHEAGLDHHLVKPAEFADIERLCRSHRGAVVESAPLAAAPASDAPSV